jgi:DNA-directed RNA polymerase specialized sigma24 family protein
MRTSLAANEEQIEAELHALMMAGDVTAPARIAEFFLPLLIKRFTSKKVDQELVDTAVADALLSYFKSPAQYDPGKLPLGKFLFMAARGDLKNMLSRRAKEVERFGFTESVELGASSSELCDEKSTDKLPAILNVLDNETDKQIVTLMAEGVRQKAAYAAVLGNSKLPPKEQAKIVKRNKDRLMKLLQRSRKKITNEEE